MAISDIQVKIGGVLKPDVKVERLTISNYQPWDVELVDNSIQHDASSFTNNHLVELSDDGFSTLLFKGWMRTNRPQGVAEEGLVYTAKGARERLQHIGTKINGRVRYVYNLDNERDTGCPDYEKGVKDFWTVGEILIDILEHARGIPGGGSAISSHQDVHTVTDTYLSDTIIDTWTPAHILAMDAEVGEFMLTATLLSDAITQVLALDGNHVYYIDPNTGNFVLLKLDALATETVYMGETGEWVDTSGESYNLEDNPMEFGLDDVHTKLILQGCDKLYEVKPDFFAPGSGYGDAVLEPYWNSELEATWEYATWLAGGYEGDDTYEWVFIRWRSPEGQRVIARDMITREKPLPIMYVYWDVEGWKGYVPVLKEVRYDCSGIWLTGFPMYYEDMEGKHAYIIYAWYCYNGGANQVTAGPSGSAYDDYSLVNELVIYDEDWVWENVGRVNQEIEYGQPYYLDPRQDTARMQKLVDALIVQMGDERMTAQLTIDSIDLDTYFLNKCVNIANAAKWSAIAAIISQIDIHPNTDTMVLTITNRQYAGGALSYDEVARRMRNKQKLKELDAKVKWIIKALKKAPPLTKKEDDEGEEGPTTEETTSGASGTTETTTSGASGTETTTSGASGTTESEPPSESSSGGPPPSSTTTTSGASGTSSGSTGTEFEHPCCPGGAPNRFAFSVSGFSGDCSDYNCSGVMEWDGHDWTWSDATHNIYLHCDVVEGHPFWHVWLTIPGPRHYGWLSWEQGGPLGNGPDCGVSCRGGTFDEDCEGTVDCSPPDRAGAHVTVSPAGGP